MKKETIIDIFLGLLFGGVVAVFISLKSKDIELFFQIENFGKPDKKANTEKNPKSVKELCLLESKDSSERQSTCNQIRRQETGRAI